MSLYRPKKSRYAAPRPALSDGMNCHPTSTPKEANGFAPDPPPLARVPKKYPPAAVALRVTFFTMS